MGDASVPIVIDTNVFINIAEGNSQAAEALTRHRKSGTPLYIARQAYRELVIEARTPRQRVLWRRMLRDLKIHVAPKGPKSRDAEFIKKARIEMLSARADIYQRNIERQTVPMALDYKPRGGLEQFKGVKGRPHKEDLSRRGDLFVAAEAHGLKARFWTLDQRAATRAAQVGVQIAPESNIPSVAGTEDLAAARKLLLGTERKQKPHVRGKAAGGSSTPATAGGRAGGAVPSARTTPKIKPSAKPVAAKSPGGRLGGGGMGTVFAEAIFSGREKQYQANVQAHVQEKLKEVDGVVAQRLAARKDEIIKVQLRTDPGEKMFANVRIRIHWLIWPEVKIEDINITTREETSERNLGVKRIKEDYGATINREVTEHVYSFEVFVFSDEEMNTFRELTGEYLSHKRRLDMLPYDAIIAEDADEVLREIKESFGSDLWFLDKSY
jgi:hypothetical protein